MRKLLLLLVTAAAARSQTAAPAAGSGFLGRKACKTCHADVWMNFYKNPHYKSVASGKEPQEKTGCEGCHGPAQKHVEARGGKTTIPRAFSVMPPKQALETCLGGHARDLARANIQRSEHTKNDVAEAGELAFLELQGGGWNTDSGEGCPPNPDLFREVIDRAEAFLAGHPRTDFRRQHPY